MVEIKHFVEGFRDLEKLYETRKRIIEAKFKINRVLIDSSLGCLDDRSILSDEERSKFVRLTGALERASELLSDKIEEQQEKCIKMNVIGFTEDNEPEVKKVDEDEFF